uniref:Aminotransferase-like plant mobile domain-containing protein n=1 Tax=Solanum tuberosum TaxID=4113 RepID=M1D9Y3_SOLTU
MKGRFHPTGRANLFAAFHHLRGENQEVSLNKWTSFWCKKPQRYEAVAAMKETKHARPESTHNPSGGLPDTTRWSHVEERMFSGHGVRDDKRDETYLAAFLSCWLCAFLLPNKDGEFVHPGTFKMASLMERGRKISLAILVLANIYNRLNKISTLSPLHQIKVCFPIHYVYGWFDHYLKTHYAFSIGPFIPTMDQARLTLHDMDVESSIKEVFVEAGECFTNAMFEEQDKVEEVSSLRQPLDNMKKEIKVLCKRAKDLQVFLTGAEDEVQGAKLATLFATHEFDACFDADLTNDLGQKKEHLEVVSRTDQITNYAWIRFYLLICLFPLEFD